MKKKKEVDGGESSHPAADTPVIDATATPLDEAAPDDRELFFPVFSSSDDGEQAMKPAETFWPLNPPWKQLIVIDEEDNIASMKENEQQEVKPPLLKFQTNVVSNAEVIVISDDDDEKEK